MTSTMESSTSSIFAARLPPAIPDLPIYRFSVEQYDQLAEAGILSADSGVELLEGWITMKHPSRRLCAEADALDLKHRDPEIPAWPVFRFSVEDYQTMLADGILHSGDRI